ncbi:beta-ketoacyl synthase N-terminal-like domain-containing protein [Amycolatopsis sp., V23-08]|uniref:Beta-ketoacyl synthase N-terminal-like domain-containing protein n=1 Tax=Amycolatopsis heterodermiae TaxID=3110235 RepID=A0ABU5R8R2_9PSEU|nr:beta-ketoacyl synthase N-terminal-like domain-containing protein [Amycolatopsis sp., V23-08]MEA5362612.1 beta-ketoacyl synthase N-terminal-like domain-containing protein [Amycolatopsis sp., V23-08]
MSTAIVGMACRFAGAAGLAAFWDLLLRAGDGGTDLDEPATPDPRYVPRGYFLENPTGFDAEYFGMTPEEAAALDPAHRLLLECVDEALGDACHQAPGSRPTVGLFAASAPSTFRERPVDADPTLTARFGEFALRAMNDPAALTAGAAYRLGFTGPCVTVSTACSSGLTAVQLAGLALERGECDIAIAATVDLVDPRPSGYARTADDGLLSSTGRPRSFDAAADGTVFASGAGAVVLRRLPDALADGDHVYATIRGAAMNNDGAARLNFTTPNWDRQEEVVRLALDRADVGPGTVGFVECHAPGTPVGDMVEFHALASVFREVPAGSTCVVGCVKPNIGHAGVAAGMAGLIKAALAVRHGVIPPTAGFRTPSPDLPFDATPFFVNTRPVPWPAGDGPRRAGVSAFGIGGSNAHVVLEQAPPPDDGAEGPSVPCLLPVSGRTEAAALTARDRLESALLAGAEAVTDVAFSLQVGRVHHRWRTALVHNGEGGAWSAVTEAGRSPRIAFVFPGDSGAYPGMGRELYETWPGYRVHADARAHATEPLAAGYALAGLLVSWGIEPSVVAGIGTGRLAAEAVAERLTAAEVVDAGAPLAGRADLLLILGPGGIPGPSAVPAVTAMAEGGESAALLGAVARAWTLGAEPDWRRLWPDRRPRRVPLPHYPYQRVRC